MENNGKYFFIPDWLLQENSQTIHAYIYILNEINRNCGELNTSYRIIAKELNLSLQKVRKTKKATNTKTAFKAFISEIESRQCDINEMLKIAVTGSWSGFKHKWVDNLKIQQKQVEKPKEEKIGRTSIETIKKNAEYNGQY